MITKTEELQKQLEGVISLTKWVRGQVIGDNDVATAIDGLQRISDYLEDLAGDL